MEEPEQEQRGPEREESAETAAIARTDASRGAPPPEKFGSGGGDGAPRGETEKRSRSYLAVLTGTVDLDEEAIYRLVRRNLEPADARTPAVLATDLESIALAFAEANKLAAKARRDYELAKEEHEVWLEAKRTSARMALEQEKAEGLIKKQISDGMVMDQVRASWPDEYANAVEKLKDFQAAVHYVESHPEAVKIRARALDARKDIMLAVGAVGREGR